MLKDTVVENKKYCIPVYEDEDGDFYTLKKSGRFDIPLTKENGSKIYWYDFKTKSENEEYAETSYTEDKNQPHYNGDACMIAMETIDSKAAMGFCQMSIIKYAWRLFKKDDAIDNLNKIIWYAERLKKQINEEK